jgi:hypothetical protein
MKQAFFAVAGVITGDALIYGLLHCLAETQLLQTQTIFSVPAAISNSADTANNQAF